MDEINLGRREKVFPDHETSLAQNYRTKINFTAFHSKYKIVLES